MKNIILSKEINNAYSNKVSDYLSRGLRIHVSTMSGSQGEISRIDLTDSSDVYRIMLTKELSHNDDFYFSNTVVIRVLRYEGANNDNSLDRANVLWDRDGELIEEYTLYEIAENVYTDNKDEIRDIKRKQIDRCKNSESRYGYQDTEIKVSDEARKHLKNICKRYSGYGKVSTDKIDKIVKRIWNDKVIYYVTFKDGCKGNLAIKSINK